jgi:thiol:disulfide interchange protein DsbA
MNFRNLLLVFLLATLAACSQGKAPESETVAAAAESAETTEPAAAESEEAPSAEAVEQAAIDTVAESAGIEEEAAETEEIVLAEDKSAAESAPAPAWKYQEGQHYNRLTTAQGTSSPPDKIEVAEIFWYGCPHCFSFEPYLEKWKPNLANDVAFVRIPVIWNPTNQIHARAFYTAQALDVSEEFHIAMFRAIHVNNKPMASEAMIQELFEKLGVDAAVFKQTFSSFAVNGNIKRAGNFTERYQIRSVPLLVINGTYKTDAPAVTSFDQMLDVANELIERERQDK